MKFQVLRIFRVSKRKMGLYSLIQVYELTVGLYLYVRQVHFERFLNPFFLSLLYARCLEVFRICPLVLFEYENYLKRKNILTTNRLYFEISFIYLVSKTIGKAHRNLRLLLNKVKMKTLKRILSLVVIVSMVSIFSCTKEGKQGEQGMSGANGTNGSSNVQNFDITLNSWDWTYDNLYQRQYYRYWVSADYNSLVVCYVMSGSGKQIMPYYEAITQRNYDFANVLYQSSPYIEIQYTDYNSPTTAPSSSKNFYLIIVPPTARLANPNVDYTNYEEVKRTFNLKE